MPKGIPNNGPRKSGCGRKSGEPTTTIAFRVPLIHEARLKLAMRNLISEMKKEQI
jgi:hypothetical protein